MEATTNKNLAFFLGINTVLAVGAMIFMFVYQLQGWPMTLITSYFMAVIGAYITIFVVRPKVMGGVINMKYFTFIIAALTLAIVVWLLLGRA